MLKTHFYTFFPQLGIPICQCFAEWTGDTCQVSSSDALSNSTTTPKSSKSKGLSKLALGAIIAASILVIVQRRRKRRSKSKEEDARRRRITSSRVAEARRTKQQRRRRD